MSSVLSMAKQAVRGLPYLEKEVKRRVSLQTGLVLTTPMTYYVIFSGRCNLECTFCTIYKQVEPIIPPETMLRVIRETKELSGSGYNISLSGGEPMLYKGLYDSLELAHKLGVNFGFTTNGLALTKSNCEKILASDPFNINISLESVDPKVNESLRPMKDGTKRTLEGVDNVLAEKERSGSRISVIVKATIMAQNYLGLPALVRHFGKQSRVQVHFQPFVGVINDPHWVKDLNALKGVFDELRQLRAEGYSVIINDRQLEGFMGYFSHPPATGIVGHLDLHGQKRNCDIGLRSMFINSDGNVYFCEYLGRPVGNINKESLSDMYYGAMAKEQRKEMVYCNIDCQQTCKRPIPLWVKASAFLRMG